MGSAIVTKDDNQVKLEEQKEILIKELLVLFKHNEQTYFC